MFNFIKDVTFDTFVLLCYIFFSFDTCNWQKIVFIIFIYFLFKVEENKDIEIRDFFRFAIPM